jgi:hypothetical protein
MSTDADDTGNLTHFHIFISQSDHLNSISYYVWISKGVLETLQQSRPNWHLSLNSGHIFALKARSFYIQLFSLRFSRAG